MKKVLGLIFVLLFAVSANAGIVNNSGSAAADSVSLPFYMLDSAGYSSVKVAANDSIFLFVFYPSGALAFKDSIVQSNARIVKDSINNGYGAYNVKLAVADIDGSGKDGVYSYYILAKDNSLSLETPTKGFFQLYQTYDYDTWADRIIDSLQAVIDTLQLQDDEYVLIRDTIYAIIDTLQLQDDEYVLVRDTVYAIIDTLQRFTKPATDTLQGIIDTLQLQDDEYVLVRDTVYAIIDTLQNQDNWGATSANQTLIIDTTYAIIDTLQRFTKPATDTLQAIIDSLQNLYQSRVVAWGDIDAATTPTTTAFTSNNLTQGDNYWTDNLIVWRTGNAAGQVARIDTFVALQDSVYMSPALSTAPAAGDTFFVIGNLWEELATVTTVVDSTWQRDTTGSTAGGSFGYAVTHASATLSDADMGAIADSVWTYDTTSISGANVIGTTAKRSYTEVKNIDEWDPITDNDSLVIDISSFEGQTPDVNVAQISADATAANNLETMLDGTGGQTLSLGQLKVVADQTIDTAVIFRSTGGGQALLIDSDTSDAIGVNSTEALAGIADAGGAGIYIDALADGIAIDAGAAAMGIAFGTGVKTIDSSVWDELFSHNDSSFADLDNELSQWLQNNMGGASGGLDTLATTFVNRLVGRVRDTTWGSDTTGYTAGGSFGYAVTHGAAASVSDADKGDIADSVAYKFGEQLLAKLGLFGLESDSNKIVRYLSTRGDNTNGLTMGTAWTTFDSLTRYTRLLDSLDYSGELYAFVGPDSFFNVVCTTFNVTTHIIGSGMFSTVVQGDTVQPATPDSSDSDVLRILGDYSSVENMTVIGFDTVGDPESGVWASGGNNAITFDVRMTEPDQTGDTLNALADTTAPNYGIVRNVNFPPPNHKPLQMNGRGRDAGYGYIIENCIFDESQFNSIDGFWGHSIIRNNVFIGHVSSTQASIQILGTSAAGQSVAGRNNIIYGNVIHDIQRAVNLGNSDSNFVFNNYIGKLLELGWASTADTLQSVFIDNKFVGSDIASNELNNMLANGGFERWVSGERSTLPYWGANNGRDTALTNHTGGVLIASTAHSGSFSLYMSGKYDDLDGTEAYQNAYTEGIELMPGTYEYRLWWLPYDANGSDATNSDTLTVRILDSTGAVFGSQVNFTDPDTSSSDWLPISNVFTITTGGIYNLSLVVGDSDACYIDDVYLGARPTVEGNGSGSFTYKAIDTANDVAVSGVSISAYNLAGQQLGFVKPTDGNGETQWVFTVGDTIVFTALFSPLWTWDSPDTVYGITNGGADSTQGYSTVIGSPATADLSRVYGYVRGVQDDKKEGIKVVASLVGTNPVDSTGEAVIITDAIAEAVSDSSGYFFLDLKRTTQYADTTRGFYNIVGYIGEKPIFEAKRVWVPDTGNLNIADWLAAR